MPAVPGDEAAWETRPQLEPLYALRDTFERVAVALGDKERARLFTVFLGQIETRQEVVDAVPGKQAFERRAEVQVVEELIEAATTPHAVLGVEATLSALHEQRVHRLVLAEGFAVLARTGGSTPRRSAHCLRCAASRTLR